MFNVDIHFRKSGYSNFGFWEARSWEGETYHKNGINEKKRSISARQMPPIFEAETPGYRMKSGFSADVMAKQGEGQH